MKKRGWVALGALVLVFTAFTLGYFFGRNFHRADYTIEMERRPAPLHTPEETAQQSVEAVKVNLNTATVDELCQLDGVGKVIAERIVAYREAHGGFQRTDELINVSGIGVATYEELEPYVTVGEGEQTAGP